MKFFGLMFVWIVFLYIWRVKNKNCNVKTASYL